MTKAYMLNNMNLLTIFRQTFLFCVNLICNNLDDESNPFYRFFLFQYTIYNFNELIQYC